MNRDKSYFVSKAVALPIIFSDGSQIALSLGVCISKIVNSIQTIEFHSFCIYFPVSADETNLLTSKLSENSQIGGMINMLGGDDLIDNVEFLYTLEIADFCEEWKTRGATIMQFPDLYKRYVLPLN